MNIIASLNKYRQMFLKKNITRSYGLLEYFLAIERAKIANKFITKEHKCGRVLDIGCGSYPIFLLTAKFVEKFGIDKIYYRASGLSKRFKLLNYDIENGEGLSFDNNSIDVVTMLAIFEHIKYSNLTNVMSEVYRILKPGGICIITVPAPWADCMLHVFSKLRLVSRIEIEDHKSNLKNSKILMILKQANFSIIKFGFFELFMNRWFLAKK